MDLLLNKKSALVLGSSRGLGFAVAHAIAAEGCNVAINSRNKEMLAQSVEKLKSMVPGNIIGIPADVTDSKAPTHLINQVVKAFGGLDILVTNSGGPPVGKFETFDDETWQQSVELIFLSHVKIIRAALPHLRSSSSPSVLTITSSTVKQPLDNLILSNSIRAATVALTNSLAIELAADGIRFNSILPGWTVTERVKEILATRAQINGTSAEFEFKKQTADIPLGRMASPEEFGNAAAFLVSPIASYITGVMLQVDGGATRGLF